MKIYKQQHANARVASLVVGVNDEVHAHELIKLRVVVAEHAGEVRRVIERRVVRRNDTVLVGDTVNERSNLREAAEKGGK